MTFATVAHTWKSGTSTGAGTTSAIDTTGADLIVLSTGWYTATANYNTASPSDSEGNTWTLINEREVAAGGGSALWYCLNPTTSASHTFTSSASGVYGSLGVQCFSGAHASSTLDQINEAGNTSITTLQPGSVTPTEDDELVITAFGQYNSAAAATIDGSFTIQTGHSVASSTGVRVGQGDAYLIQTSAAAANPTWNWTNSAGGNATIATFKAAAAGGAYTLTAGQASFTLTGNAATLTKQSKLTAAQASFTLTGNAAGLTHGHKLTAAHGSFSLTGNAATLTKQSVLAAAYGAFALTGQDATLTHGAGATLVADAGTFVLTGQAAGLTKQSLLTANTGTFTLSGQSATLRHGYTLSAAHGVFALTGRAATLTKQSVLSAVTGSFVLTGNVATLAYSASGDVASVTPGIFVTPKIRKPRKPRNARTAKTVPPLEAPAPITLQADAEIDWSLVTRRLEASLAKDRQRRQNMQRLMLLMAA